MPAADTFNARLNAAIRAGWWIVLILLVVVLLQYILYLLIVGLNLTFMSSLWLLPMDYVARLWFAFIGLMKLMAMTALLGVIFLMLWRRQLNRADTAR